MRKLQNKAGVATELDIHVTGNTQTGQIMTTAYLKVTKYLLWGRGSARFYFLSGALATAQRSAAAQSTFLWARACGLDLGE